MPRFFFFIFSINLLLYLLRKLVNIFFMFLRKAILFSMISQDTRHFLVILSLMNKQCNYVFLLRWFYISVDMYSFIKFLIEFNYSLILSILLLCKLIVDKSIDIYKYIYMLNCWYFGPLNDNNTISSPKIIYLGSFVNNIYSLNM